mgnify:CR=1 FL=1
MKLNCVTEILRVYSIKFIQNILCFLFLKVNKTEKKILKKKLDDQDSIRGKILFFTSFKKNFPPHIKKCVTSVFGIYGMNLFFVKKRKKKTSKINKKLDTLCFHTHAHASKKML